MAVRQKKIRRGRIATPSHYESLYESDESTHTFLDAITHPHTDYKPFPEEIREALREIEWYARQGPLPANWQNFLTKHKNGEKKRFLSLDELYRAERNGPEGEVTKNSAKPQTNVPAPQKSAGTGVSARSSFVGETEIKTKTGYKPIEEIREGESVLSRNELTGEISHNRVTHIHSHRTDRLYSLRYRDGTILNVTGNHKLFLSGGQVAEVRSLHAGDSSLTAKERESLRIQSIEKFTPDQPVTVYNLEVENHHTYFVTRQDIWVHNQTEEYSSGLRMLLEQLTEALGKGYAQAKGAESTGWELSKILVLLTTGEAGPFLKAILDFLQNIRTMGATGGIHTPARIMLEDLIRSEIKLVRLEWRMAKETLTYSIRERENFLSQFTNHDRKEQEQREAREKETQAISQLLDLPSLPEELPTERENSKKETIPLEQIRYQEELLIKDRDKLQGEKESFGERFDTLQNLLRDNKTTHPLHTGSRFLMYAHDYSSRPGLLTTEIRAIQNFTLHYAISQAATTTTAGELFPGLPDSELAAIYDPVEEYLKSLSEERGRELFSFRTSTLPTCSKPTCTCWCTNTTETGERSKKFVTAQRMCPISKED